MKFVLRKQCFSYSRVGLLCFESISNNDNNVKTEKDYSTPICLQYTINRSVPHIVCELLQDLNDDNCPLLLPLPTTLLMNESLRKFNTKFNGIKSGITRFAGFQTWRPTIVSVHDPLSAIRTHQNSVEGIGMYCRGGKHTVNSSKLIDVMSNFRPDAYQALCDSDTPFETSNKRIQRSVDRSLYLLEECINKQKDAEILCKTSVLGTIEGGFNLKARMKSVEETASKEVDGFVIDGFHTYGQQIADNFDLNGVQPILKQIIENLPKDKPKAMFGALTPLLIMKLIANGIDIFDSSYATVMTEKGFALQEIIDLKQMKISDKTIDLNHKQYKEDFGPLEELCECYSCSNHFSRAYINHLLNASEMLAKVLLMFHNLHVFYQFFRTVRLILEEEKFEEIIKKL